MKPMLSKSISDQHAELIRQFKQAYALFDTSTISALKGLYDPAIIFVDPLHKVEGWAALERYFSASALNLSYCRFEFIDTVVGEQAAFFKWHMHYAHGKIARGKALKLVGASEIKFAERITYHEDFYDLGAMVYEHVPLFGLGIQKIKMCMARAGSGGR
jgi:SnoaL-like domain